MLDIQNYCHFNPDKMKYYIILFISISFLSCKKGNDELIRLPINLNHKSAIFIGNDSIIYGKWEYLYTIQNSWGGSSQSKLNTRYSINIIPFNNFELFKDDSTYFTGKIDTLKHSENFIRAIFIIDGLVKQSAMPEELYIINSDTLVKGSSAMNDGEYYDYFKRIKNF
jgi:hypothetical protein